MEKEQQVCVTHLTIWGVLVAGPHLFIHKVDWRKREISMHNNKLSNKLSNNSNNHTHTHTHTTHPTAQRTDGVVLVPATHCALDGDFGGDSPAISHVGVHNGVRLFVGVELHWAKQHIAGLDSVRVRVFVVLRAPLEVLCWDNGDMQCQ